MASRLALAVVAGFALSVGFGSAQGQGVPGAGGQAVTPESEARVGEQTAAFRGRLSRISVETIASATDLPDAPFVAEASGAQDPLLRELFVRAARIHFMQKSLSDAQAFDGLPDAGRAELMFRITGALAAENADNVEWLKERLDAVDWFTISAYGARADKAAASIVLHADRDMEWQAQVLATLEPLANAGEASRVSYASLYDMVAWRRGEPLRYGTLGWCATSGSWEPFRLEGSEIEVDARRQDAGLAPLAEQRARSAWACAKLQN